MNRLIEFINNVLPLRFQNNLGFFNFGGGGGVSGKETSINDYKWNQNPEYAEAEAGRKMWWERLQEWGGQPGYGAISPDWGDIWGQAQQRIRDYYSGTATQPGAISKIRASAARRGVSDSPAVDTEITKALVEQGGQMGDLASQQSLAESQFSEGARQNWLASLMDMSRMKPAGMWQSTGGSQFGWDVNVEGGIGKK